MKPLFQSLILLLLLGACVMPASRAPSSIDVPAASPSRPAVNPFAGRSTPAGGAPWAGFPPDASPTPPASSPVGRSPTSTPGWCPLQDAPPAASAGKLRVIYTSSRDLWLWEEGAEAVRLTQSGDVETALLSPDGRVAAYTRRPGKGQAEIWVMDLEQRAGLLLLDGRQLNGLRPEADLTAVIPSGLQWVPGTSLLAFNTYPITKGDQVWVYLPDDLWLLDSHSGALTALLPQGLGGEAVFSPDGARAAVFKVDGLDLVAVNGADSKVDVLDSYFAVSEGESYFFPRPAWTPDSSALFAALPASEEMYDAQAQVTVWRIPAESGVPVLLKTFPAFAPSVQFSPSRDRLAAWRWPEPGSSIRELQVLDLETMEVGSYASGEMLEFLGWSPGLDMFAYAKGSPPSLLLGQLCVSPVLLPSFNMPPLSLRWVDSSRFLFLSPTPGPFELRLYTPTGIKTLAPIWGEGPAYDLAILN